jgi:hypothetical protein
MRSVDEPVSTVIDARPAALVNGKSVRWGELRPALNEIAGAEALRDLILDRALEAAAAEARLVVTDDDLAAEERRLLRTLSDDPATALRLLDELRDVQGLGDARHRALLRRNAILRALVQDRVNVTESTVQQLHDARHGPKRQVRLITTADLQGALAAIRAVRAGAFMGDVAVEASTDASAARGGLLEPVSQYDPSYPPALRQAIWNLAAQPGSLSDPTLLDTGYAIVQLVRAIPGDGKTLEEARPELEAIGRTSQERLLMDQTALQLMTGVQVTIFDEALDDSWERYQRRVRRQ